MTTPKLDRRTFLAACAAAAGGLAVGFAPGTRARAVREQELNAFIRLRPDGRVTLINPTNEMGQGTYTTLPAIIADELELDWNRVDIEFAPNDPKYNGWGGGQITAASMSVRHWYPRLRQLAAATRESLRATAAERWKVSLDECSAANGAIVHVPSGRRLDYGDLAEAAAGKPLSQSPPLKSTKDFKYIGHHLPRRDTPSKVNGQAIFAADVRLPGQVYGAVRSAPQFGGKVVSYDAAAIKALSGVLGVFEVPGGIAVVAQTWWQARRAVTQLPVQFSQGDSHGLSSETIEASLQAALEQADGAEARGTGDALAAIEAAEDVHTAVYDAPYLAHACMEPLAATVSATADSVEVHVSTQSQSTVARQVASALGVPPEKVRVEPTFIGGGFGRKISDNRAAVQAAVLSAAVKRPVQVIWNRELDIQHDGYRPITKIRLSAVTAKDGTPQALLTRIASPSLFAASERPLNGGIDPPAVAGFRDWPYATPNMRVEYVRKDFPVPLAFWRAVGLSHNPFARECFVDELAIRAKVDPVTYRSSLLAKEPRLLRVLQTLARESGWEKKPLSQGRAAGVALQEGVGSIVGQVAEVSVAKDGSIRVERVIAVVDCGLVLSPDTVRAQIEGGVVFALTAALYGEISLRDGAVVQSNFHDYPMLRMNECPHVEVHLLESDAAPGGVGEIGGPPIAPAVANAVFAATGVRMRSMPFSHHRAQLARAMGEKGVS
jgi:isoquinoline 1-oxidoreductase subunit beta